ncbi:MAG: fimbrillin family protein, partial [Bacteroidales bacterium]|nr:fimbrillin family protein [Bacteroidales bacterium]
MKRYYLSFGMMLACALALVSCTKEIENPLENEGENNVEVEEGVPFSVFAFSDQTKTTIEGFATSWAASDAINLFHAEPPTSTYVSDGAFSISAEDLSAGIFRGKLASALEGGKRYDWYAIYPYTSYAATPATRTEGSAIIGSAYDGNQTQTGNNNTSHLCATACPLYGVAKGVAASEATSLQMHHLASILEVEVVNSTGSPLVVENISFKAPDGKKIVGKFYVDITGETPVYAAKETESSNVASLTVASGEAIANGASAKFYLAVKPFTASAGETLSISVNGHEKHINLSEDFSFNAGKVEKLKFTTNWDPVGTFLDKMLTETMYCGINYWGLRWGSKVIRVFPADDPAMKFIGHYYVDKANRTIHFTFYKDGVVRRFTPELEVVGNTLKFKQPIQYDAETTLSGFTIENQGYDHDVIKLEGMKSGWAF